MRFRLAWDPAALSVFYRLPIHTATLVDRTIIRFAETGEGEIAWNPPYHLLRAGFRDVVLAVDRAARVITVLRIHRAR